MEEIYKENDNFNGKDKKVKEIAKDIEEIEKKLKENQDYIIKISTS